LKHAVLELETFADKKALILRQQEAERQRILKMQRPAILRLLEAREMEKIAEILTQEFSNDGIVEFFEVVEQMEEKGVTVVGRMLTEYILTHHKSEF